MKIVKKVEFSPTELSDLMGVHDIWRSFVQNCSETHCDTCVFWGFCNICSNIDEDFNVFQDKMSENMLERV